MRQRVSHEILSQEQISAHIRGDRSGGHHQEAQTRGLHEVEHGALMLWDQRRSRSGSGVCVRVRVRKNLRSAPDGPISVLGEILVKHASHVGGAKPPTSTHFLGFRIFSSERRFCTRSHLFVVASSGTRAHVYIRLRSCVHKGVSRAHVLFASRCLCATDLRGEDRFRREGPRHPACVRYS